MKAKSIIIIFFLLLLNFLSYSQDTISFNRAKENIGKEAIVFGKIDQITHTEKAIYINMGGKFPNNIFTAVIFSENFILFQEIDFFLGKEAYISGKVGEYNNKPQIILKSESQISYRK